MPEDLIRDSKASTEPYPNPENWPFFCPTSGYITLAAVTPTKIVADTATKALDDNPAFPSYPINPNSALPTLTLCQELSLCGFNCVMLQLPKAYSTVKQQASYIESAINVCKQCSLVPFIRTSALLTATGVNTELVKELADNNSLGGWWLPTPTYSEVMNSTSSASSPGDIYKDIWEKDKDTSRVRKHIIIMNALPNTTDSYQKYLETFQSSIKPSLWGIDAITSFADEKQAQWKHFDLNIFFRDLEILSLVSRYCGRPFWYTVRCMAYTNKKTNKATPYPSLVEMRFSAFAALAYGAQGLQYWSYRQLSNNNDFDYTAAPVDANGQKVTAIWNAVQQINWEIRRLNSVFFESEVIQVRHTGSEQYEATALLKGSFGPLISVSSTSILLSHLNTHGQDYLVIVSQILDPGDLVIPIQKVKLEFADCYKIYRLTPSEDPVGYKESLITSTTVEVSIPSGGYLIYKWNPK